MKRIFKILTPIRLLLFSVTAIVLGFVIWGDKGIYEREQLRYLNNKLEKERQNILITIKRLQEEKELLSDKRMLENTIRKELGYVKPGEVIFELRDIKGPDILDQTEKLEGKKE